MKSKVFATVILLIMSPFIYTDRDQETHPQAQVKTQENSIDALFTALKKVETGDITGTYPIGAAGEIGPYQITENYFIDSGVSGTYQQCNDIEFSKKVMVAYWHRWCPTALRQVDYQILARTHNGGPRGAGKTATLTHWNKVKGLIGS